MDEFYVIFARNARIFSTTFARKKIFFSEIGESGTSRAPCLLRLLRLCLSCRRGTSWISLSGSFQARDGDALAFWQIAWSFRQCIMTLRGKINTQLSYIVTGLRTFVLRSKANFTMSESYFTHATRL